MQKLSTINSEKPANDDRSTDADWAAVLLSALALGLLWCTFRETQKTATAAMLSADAASRAAKAAEKAIEDQAKVADRQLRPYLDLAHRDPPGKPYQKTDNISVPIKNFGQTPAQQVVIHYGSDMRKFPLGDGPLIETDETERFNAIAPGNLTVPEFSVSDLSDAEIAEIRSGVAALIIRVDVEYDLPGGGSDRHPHLMIVDDEAWEVGDPRMVAKADRERGKKV